MPSSLHRGRIGLKEKRIIGRTTTMKNKNPRTTLFVGEKKLEQQLLTILLRTSLPLIAGHRGCQRCGKGRPKAGMEGERFKDRTPQMASRHRDKSPRGAVVAQFFPTALSLSLI
jgi:hypothetical protein